MNTEKVTRSAAKRLLPSRIIKTLTEVLMIKTGIKAGPEFTGGQ